MPSSVLNSCNNSNRLSLMGCFPCLGMGPPGTSTSNCATNRKRVGSRKSFLLRGSTNDL